MVRVTFSPVWSEVPARLAELARVVCLSTGFFEKRAKLFLAGGDILAEMDQVKVTLVTSSEAFDERTPDGRQQLDGGSRLDASEDADHHAGNNKQLAVFQGNHTGRARFIIDQR